MEQQAPTTLAVALSKGGVGKTTTAAALGHACALQGRRTLLIDTDTQGQLATWLGIRAPDVSLADLLDGADPQACIIPTGRPGLDLIAGGQALAGISREIARRDLAAERVLRDALAPIVARYSLTIIDTPPGWGPLSINALVAADVVLAPVAVEPAAVDGLRSFLARLEQVRAVRPELRLIGILPTLFDGRTRVSRDVLRQLLDHFGDLVLPEIPVSVRLREAPAWGQTILEYAPNTPAGRAYAHLSEILL